MFMGSVNSAQDPLEKHEMLFSKKKKKKKVKRRHWTWPLYPNGYYIHGIHGSCHLSMYRSLLRIVVTTCESDRWIKYGGSMWKVKVIVYHKPSTILTDCDKCCVSRTVTNNILLSQFLHLFDPPNPRHGFMPINSSPIIISR